jgi:hypothetical protein
MGSTTTRLSLYKPDVGETGYGLNVNGNFDTLDTNIFLQSIGGGDTSTVPNQNTPITFGHYTAGVYSISGAGNVFNLCAYAENSGTTPTVAVFGETRAMGSGSQAWGGNFVGYVNHATSGDAIGIEIDFGKLVSSTGGAYGLVCVSYGGHNATAHVQLQTGATASEPTYGIVFNGSSFKPALTALLKTIGTNAPSYGIDFSTMTFTTQAIRIANNQGFAALRSTGEEHEFLTYDSNNDIIINRGGLSFQTGAIFIIGAGGRTYDIRNSSNTSIWKIDPVAGTITHGDGFGLVFGTTTGTKIGTATSQKIGFFNATPVVQPSTTGTATGFVANTGTAVNDASTFTGAVGTTAYRISDIVKHLKNLGLIAA